MRKTFSTLLAAALVTTMAAPTTTFAAKRIVFGGGPAGGTFQVVANAIQVYDPVNGKPGVTRWQKIAIEEDQTRVEFTPLTGRTHQLRVHAAHHQGLGCPIVGDALYGTGKEGGQMMLHASFLCFTHPASEEPVTFESDVPF